MRRSALKLLIISCKSQRSDLVKRWVKLTESNEAQTSCPSIDYQKTCRTSVSAALAQFPDVLRGQILAKSLSLLYFCEPDKFCPPVVVNTRDLQPTYSYIQNGRNFHKTMSRTLLCHLTSSNAVLALSVSRGVIHPRIWLANHSMPIQVSIPKWECIMRSDRSLRTWFLAGVGMSFRYFAIDTVCSKITR
jgi:hypothetical protein